MATKCIGVPTTRGARQRTRVVPAAICTAVITAAVGMVSPSAGAAPAAATRAGHDQPYRPQFHFTPAKNWMNDPNGLIYYKGQYHLFFQYNPSGNTWGNISWGHAVSTDLVHWKQLPVAIPEDASEYVFSGSVVLDKTNSSGFGTLVKPPLVAMYTSANKATGIQAQSLAYSLDGGRTFTKYAGNPVVDLGSNNFRDPKVFWYAPSRQWRMVVALSADHKISIYSSKNLKSWTHLSDFGPTGATGGVWECPDLFPLAVDGDKRHVKWVMVVNINPGGIAGGSGAQYFTGSFDGTTFTPDDPATYTPPKGRVLENFEHPTYAPWTTAGTAFGAGPSSGPLPGQLGLAGYQGAQLANSFAGGDAATGVLTSSTFTVTRRYLNFLVGGGNHPHVPGSTLSTTPPPGPVFADFEGSTWGVGWTATGDFTAAGPVAGTVGDQQPVTGYLGQQLVNTFLDHDASTGTITSPAFTVTSDYIDFLIGGGNHPMSAADPTAVNLLVDGNVVATATGSNGEALNWVRWNVAALKGRQAQIQIVDQNSGGWGHLNVDNFVFSSEAATLVSTETAVNLVVGGKVVRSATGANSESLDWTDWDLTDLIGRRATIQLIDNNTAGWGHLTADQFTAADAPAESTTQRAHWLDYGRDYYAAATWNDAPGNRRIQIAWMNNWDYGGNIPTDPWRSAMSVPRQLTLSTVNGRTTVVGRPVSQLTSLRSPSPYRISGARLIQGATSLRGPGSSGDTVEIQAQFAAKDAKQFGLNVRVGPGERTVIGYDTIRGGIYLDRTRSGDVAFDPTFASSEFAPLKAVNGVVTLHMLVDRSSVEVFGDNGAVALTDQIFPKLSSNTVQLFSTGGRAQLKNLSMWQIKTARR